MNKFRIILLFAVFLLLSGRAAFSEDTTITIADNPEAILIPEEKPYYQRAKEGWFWYKDELPKPKEKKKEVTNKDKDRSPSLKDYSYDQLWQMHPDDFQELLMKFQKKAVQTLTPADTKEYYVMQDIARKKSLAFANLTGYVMQTSPELSVDAANPLTAPGRNALVRSVSTEIDDRLKKSSEDFAMIYFYSPQCHFCVEQDGIMKYFQKKYAWEIKKIDITREVTLASQFNVISTPYIILVYKHSKDFIPITAGVVSLTDMEERLDRGMRLLTGELTPDNYSLHDFQKGNAFDVQKKNDSSWRQDNEK